MAWDRPLFLDKPLTRGGRISAHAVLPGAGELPTGRLGGGGANAAAALVNAGHQAVVASVVENSPIGTMILETAGAMGIETEYVVRSNQSTGTTLLLVEPDGERVVLRIRDSNTASADDRDDVAQLFACTLNNALTSGSYDALFLRAPIVPTAFDLMTFPGVILAHGPGTAEAPADYVIASLDDLNRQGLAPGDAFRAASQSTGERLKALIVTDGACGGYALTHSDGKVPFSSPQVKQIDSTGAGDCFAAGFLEANTAGAPLREALNHGADWGAATAARCGSTLGASERIYHPHKDQ